MITVGRLREILADLPQDVLIVLQKDDEGNGYRYMNGIDFEPHGDDANYFNGEDCVRMADIDEDYYTSEDFDQLVAVAY